MSYPPQGNVVQLHQASHQKGGGDALPDLHWLNIPRKPGSYITGSLMSGTTDTITIGDTTFLVAPLIVTKTITFDRIAIEVITAIALKKARAGIYLDDGTIYPGALDAESAEFDCSTTGIKETVINKSYTDRIIWLAVKAGGGVGGADYRARVHTWSPALWGHYDGATTLALTVGGLSAAQAYGALPATFPAGATVLQNHAAVVHLRTV